MIGQLVNETRRKPQGPVESEMTGGVPPTHSICGEKASENYSKGNR